MDLQTSILCLGLVIVSGIIVFFISTLGTRSQSYEEVKAANRKLVAQSGLLDDPEKQKRLMQQQLKKNKKAGKKVKEKQAKEAEAARNALSEIDSETSPSGHDDSTDILEAPIVKIEEPPKANKNKRKSKETKMKPISFIKDDPSDTSDPPTPHIEFQDNRFEDFVFKDVVYNEKCVRVNRDDPSDTSNPPSPVFTRFRYNALLKRYEEYNVKEYNDALQISIKEKDKTEVSSKAPKETAKASTKPNKSTKTPKVEKEKIVKAPQVETIVPVEPPKEQRKSKNKTVSPSTTKEPATAEKKEVAAIAPIPVQPVDIVVKTETPPMSAAIPVNIVEVQAKQSPPPSQLNAKKKKKNELAQYQQLITCPEGVNVNVLVQLLEEISLSRSEIQILTDCLLNKQNGPLPEHSEWSEGPKDPMQKMKKQLAERVKALAAEQDAVQGMQIKLKELRASLNMERARCTQITQASEENTRDLRTEMAKMETRIQRGIDENHTLRQQALQMQAKIAGEAELTAQRNQMELHIQNLSDQNVTLTNNITTIQKENAELRESHNAINAKLAETIDRNRHLETVVEENDLRFSKQANDTSKLLSEAQTEVQRLTAVHSNSKQQTMLSEKQHEELDRHNRQLMDDINNLKAEKERLNETVKELEEKLIAQPTANGNSAEKDDTINIEKAVAAARMELEKNYDQQLDALQTELNQYKDKNNDLRTKNWKIMDALTAAETKLKKSETQTTDENSVREALIKTFAEEENSKKAVLQRLFPQLIVKSDSYKDWFEAFIDEANNGKVNIEELKNENVTLKTSLDKYKKIIDTKDEDLSRIKTDATEIDTKWQNQFADKLKELEELQKKSANKEVLVEQYLDEQNQSKEILQRLFPNATASGKSYKEWLSDFAEKVSKSLSAAASDKNSDEGQSIDQLLIDNRRLQTAAEHYKKIIDEMDHTLSKIQDGATEMDKKWEICVANKQKELDESKEQSVKMEKEIQTLKHDLEKQCKKIIDRESTENNAFSKTNKSLGGMAEFEKLSQENANLRETIERLQSATLALNGPAQLHTITSYDRKASKKRRSIAENGIPGVSAIGGNAAHAVP